MTVIAPEPTTQARVGDLVCGECRLSADRQHSVTAQTRDITRVDETSTRQWTESATKDLTRIQESSTRRFQDNAFARDLTRTNQSTRSITDDDARDITRLNTSTRQFTDTQTRTLQRILESATRQHSDTNTRTLTRALENATRDFDDTTDVQSLRLDIDAYRRSRDILEECIDHFVHEEDCAIPFIELISALRIEERTVTD